MLTEDSIFRLCHNEKWSFKLTRSELIRKLEQHAINRSWNWPYSLKIGQDRALKNPCGLIVIVRKELSYAVEHQFEKEGKELPYSVVF